MERDPARQPNGEEVQNKKKSALGVDATAYEIEGPCFDGCACSRCWRGWNDPLPRLIWYRILYLWEIVKCRLIYTWFTLKEKSNPRYIWFVLTDRNND